MKRGLLFILILFLFLNASSQFTPGNIVVSRVGDGATALSNASAQVQLVEYTVAGTATGIVVTLPIVSGGAGNRACTNSGSATTEGYLNQSYDGRYLVHVGYDAVPGIAGVVASGLNFNRVVARIDASGNVNTSTSFLATAGNTYSGVNIRSAYSYDGSQFWTSGGSSGTAGVRYLMLGQDNITGTQISTTSTNTRDLQIFQDQLYISTAAGAIRIGTVGSGMPTTTGQTITNLPGIPTTTLGPNSFIFFDRDQTVAGPDLMYVACQSLTLGDFGLFKYSFDGTTWIARGSIQTNAQLFGITGYLDCSGNVVLYTTRASGGSALPTQIRQFIDNAAYNATITNSGGDFLTLSTLLQTASGNYAFRGISMSPAQGYTISGPQNIAAGNYNVITVKNNGIATLTGDIVIYDRIVVEPGGTLIMGTNTISSPAGIASTFELKNGGTLKIGSPDGITAATIGPGGGNVQTCIRRFDPFAIYEYNGTSIQSTGDGLPTTVSGTLKINNTTGIGSSGVSLTQNTTISGVLDLTSGKLTTSISAGIPTIAHNAVAINYSNASFVYGRMIKTGDENFEFPIGEGAEMHKIALLQGTGHTATDQYQVQYFKANPRTTFSGTTPPGTDHMSGLEYWMVNRNAGSATKKVMLEATTYTDATDLTRLVIINNPTATTWQNDGRSTSSGAFVGTVTSNDVSSVGPFTFASLDPYPTNPLPITLLSFDATKLSSSTSSINWELAVSCSPDTKFEVQRAGIDKAFTRIGMMPGSTTNKSYTYFDNNLLTGINYYRLKMIDETGKISYTRTVAIMNGVKGLLLTSLVPTIITNTATLTITSSSRQQLDIIIVDMQGRTVNKQHFTVNAGNTSIELSLSRLAAGIYYLQGISADGKTNTIRFIR